MLRAAVHAMGQFLVSHSQPAAPPRRRGDPNADTAAHALLRNAPAGRLAAGVMQIVATDEIEQRLGSRWPQVADRADQAIAAAIHAGLGPDDLVQQRDAGSYVLCFPGLDRAEAGVRTRAIVADVEARLLDQVPEYGEAAVRHTVSEVDCELALSADAAPLDAVAAQLESIRQEVDDAVRRARTFLANHAELCYAPIWSSASELVDCYIPRLDDCTGRELFEYLKLVGDPVTLADLTGEVDGVVLGRAVRALHEALQQGCHARLLMPVNYTTLCRSGNRERYLKLCRSIPEGYRKHLRLELYGVPASVPDTRLLEVLQPLRSFAAGLCVEVRLGARGWSHLFDKGLSAVAVDAADLADGRLEQLKALTKAARGAKCEVYLHRINRRGLAVLALQSGVHHLDGEAVAHTVALPNRRYRMRAPFAASRTKPAG